MGFENEDENKMSQTLREFFTLAAGTVYALGDAMNYMINGDDNGPPSEEELKALESEYFPRKHEEPSMCEGNGIMPTPKNIDECLTQSLIGEFNDPLTEPLTESPSPDGTLEITDEPDDFTTKIDLTPKGGI